MKIGVVALVATMSVPATCIPAHAEDQRPCVSKAEFRGVRLEGPVTRADLEDRWEVSPSSRNDDFGAPAYNYKACGFSPEEAAVTIVVISGANPRVPTRNLVVTEVQRWRKLAATPHGNP